MQEQKNNKFPNLFICIVLLILAATLNFVGSFIIQKYFPDRAAPPDLLFKITHYVGWTQYLTDIANIFSFILMICYLIRYAKNDANFIILNYALAYALRSVLIVLTPLGGALGNNMYYGITTIQQFGAFPSGHTIMVALTYMLISKEKSSSFKNLALASVIIEVISLILSRGHYSIDIVGAFLVCYFVVNEMRKYQKSPEIYLNSESTI